MSICYKGLIVICDGLSSHFTPSLRWDFHGLVFFFSFFLFSSSFSLFDFFKKKSKNTHSFSLWGDFVVQNPSIQQQKKIVNNRSFQVLQNKKNLSNTSVKFPFYTRAGGNGVGRLRCKREIFLKNSFFFTFFFFCFEAPVLSVEGALQDRCLPLPVFGKTRKKQKTKKKTKIRKRPVFLLHNLPTPFFFPHLTPCSVTSACSK